MNVYTRYTCKWQIFGNVRNCHLLPIIFTLSLPSYLIVTVSTGILTSGQQSRWLDLWMSSQFTYPQKLTHVRHLAIKILLNAKNKNIKILVQHPIKTVLFEQFCNTVSTVCLALLLFSNVRETSSYQVFIDIDNLWTRFSTIGERGCAAIDQIQTGHSISIGQFNSSCRWMKC